VEGGDIFLMPPPRLPVRDARSYVTTAIGRIHLAGVSEGRPTTAVLLVLNGRIVYGDPHLDRDGNVVHLDARAFHARWPERTVLVDEAGALRAVEAALKALWRTRLTEAKRTLPAEVFVARFFDAAVTWDAGELLTDVPWLPGKLFARITGYPIQEGYGQALYVQPLRGLVEREQFARGALRAVMLPATRTDTAAYWMFARARQLLVLTRTWGLAAGHWLWEYVPELDAQPAKVEITGERASAPLHGQRVAAEVILCQSYRVGIGGEASEVTEQAMAWPGATGVRILVPDGEQGGAAVRQCASYIDADHRFRPELAAQDRAALAALIRELRAHGAGYPFLPARRAPGAGDLGERQSLGAG
jgi:hypothetical protein